MDCILTSGTGTGPANLEYLRNRKAGDSAVTALAKKTFEESQAMTLGWGHTLKKYGTGAAVFVGTIGACVTVAGTVIYFSLPSTKEGWWSLGISGAGIGLSNKGFAKLTGINIGNQMMSMIKGAIVGGAALACSYAVSSYGEIEADVKKAQESARGKIIDSLKDAYNQAAQALKDKLQKVDNPHELFLYKVEAEALSRQLGEIQAQFAKFGLNGVDSATILGDLTSTLNMIQSIPFALDAEKGSKKFNFELMTMENIPFDQAAAGAIPPSVRNHVKNAQDNQLGMLHSMKKYSYSALAGLAVSAAATTGVALAGFGLQEALDRRIPPVGIAAVALPAGLAVGAKTASNVFQRYADERAKKDMNVAESYTAAKNQLKAVYAGLAESLEECGNDKQAKAEAIRAKLPAIEKQIMALKIPGLTTDEVLEPLHTALNDNRLVKNASWMQG